MTPLREELDRLVGSLSFSVWGIADISGLHPLAEQYPRALSLGLAYQAPFRNYDEAAYYALTLQVKESFDPKFDSVVSFLSERGIGHYAVPANLKIPTGTFRNFPIVWRQCEPVSAGSAKAVC